MNGVVTICLSLLIFCGIIATVYIIFYNNIQAFQIKINEAESIIDDLLRKKYDLLDSMKNTVIKNTELPEKTFDTFNNLKKLNISSFELERKLTENYNLVDQIKNDYEEIMNDEDFMKDFEDIYEVNEKLEAAKSFYNKYTTFLNGVIKKFPSNIIAKLHHIKVKAYFDGKDMFDDEIKDFKL